MGNFDGSIEGVNVGFPVGIVEGAIDGLTEGDKVGFNEEGANDGLAANARRICAISHQLTVVTNIILVFFLEDILLSIIVKK